MIKEIALADNRIFRMLQDENPESPRAWDNLGTMACFHRGYTLGDRDIPFSSSQFDSWGEMEEHIENDLEAVVVLPLFLYDHSGITMATTPFSCRWDSGQVGYIYVTKERLQKEYDTQEITEEILDKARMILQGEVETYDMYLTGDIYGFEIIKQEQCDQGHVHEKHEDSCWGFYGHDINKNGILDHINEADCKIILGQF